jgi:hypothetical protein
MQLVQSLDEEYFRGLCMELHKLGKNLHAGSENNSPTFDTVCMCLHQVEMVNKPSPSTSISTTKPQQEVLALSTTVRDAPKAKSQSVCPYHLKNKCKRGDKCTMFHMSADDLRLVRDQKLAETHQSQATSNHKAAKPKQDGESKKDVCRKYIAGTCTFSPCKFYHPPKSDSTTVSASFVSSDINIIDHTDCSALSLVVPTAENRIDFVVDTGYVTGSLNIAALVQSTAGLSYVQSYDMSVETACPTSLRIVAKGTLNGYFHMSDNTFRQISVEALVAPSTKNNLLNPNCLDGYRVRSMEPTDRFTWCTEAGVEIRTLMSGQRFTVKKIPIYYFEGEVPGHDPNFTTHMYDPLPLSDLTEVPKCLSHAFAVNALYLNQMYDEDVEVPDPKSADVPLSEGNYGDPVCDSIEFLDDAGVPVDLGNPDDVDEPSWKLCRE